MKWLPRTGWRGGIGGNRAIAAARRFGADLMRHGYRLKGMVEQFGAKPAEIRALFINQLDPGRESR